MQRIDLSIASMSLIYQTMLDILSDGGKSHETLQNTSVGIRDRRLAGR
jgi:hypothetical protein